MTRAYSIYLSMFVVLGLGLTAVLRWGAELRAPVDLSGDWDVAWSEPAPAGLARAHRLRVEQSGRFLVLHFDARLRLSMRLEGGSALGDHGSPLIADLRGERASVALARGPEPETLELTLADRSIYTALVRRPSRADER